jgi:hypothetical protein
MRPLHPTHFTLPLLAGLLAVACTTSDSDPRWVIPDGAGHGVTLYDRPDGRAVETLRVAGGPLVTPLRVQGNHWEVRTSSGRNAWLDSSEFPVPTLDGPYVALHQIHVATAFAFADEARDPLLAIQVDTLVGRAELHSSELFGEVQKVWSLYRPLSTGMQRVSITVLSGESDLDAPFRSADGEVLGYRRLLWRLCSHRLDDIAWSPLGHCKSERWLTRPGGFRWRPPWATKPK